MTKATLFLYKSDYAPTAEINASQIIKITPCDENRFYVFVRYGNETVTYDCYEVAFN